MKGGSRSRNPPRDAFNATVSYLSALAMRETEHAIRRAGLHPGFGALHVARDYGDACVYDLVEEFRAPLTEGPAVYLFNVGTLKPEGFSKRPGGGIRITGKARGEIIRTFRRTLCTAFTNPWTGRRTTWGGMLLHQARALARHHLAGEPYQSYRVDT